MTQTYIVIDLSEHKLFLHQNDEIRFSFPVAVGKSQTPTPIGNWHIVNKKILVEPSIYGSRWMGLNHPGYGIHGTNQPSAIGTDVSHGCIRMYNADVERLFDIVSIDTPVIVAP